MQGGQLQSLGDQALTWADRALGKRPHQELTLGLVAGEIGGTPPTLHTAHGSLIGFHARLAALQWERANAALDASPRTPMGLAMADIEFAIDNPNRFLLMYDPKLWRRQSDKALGKAPARERAALQEMAAERNDNYRRFDYALGGKGKESRTRLVTSLLTGLCFEFVCERLFQGDRERQLAHAKELLQMVL